MATQTQRDRIRADLQATTASLSDASIDDLFTRAGETYPDNAAAIEIEARLLAIRQLRMSAAKLVDYQQNMTNQKSSQYFNQLSALERDYRADLESALTSASGNAQWGLMRPTPTRTEEYPNTYPYPFGWNGVVDVD